MAHPRTVAVRRQVADKRLREVAAAASNVFGVTLKNGLTLASRHPDLAAAELVENVADFIQELTAAHQRQPRKAG